jgi:hypothetical protein
VTSAPAKQWLRAPLAGVIVLAGEAAMVVACFAVFGRYLAIRRR